MFYYCRAWRFSILFFHFFFFQLSNTYLLFNPHIFAFLYFHTDMVSYLQVKFIDQLITASSQTVSGEIQPKLSSRWPHVLLACLDNRPDGKSNHLPQLRRQYCLCISYFNFLHFSCVCGFCLFVYLFNIADTVLADSFNKQTFSHFLSPSLWLD